MIVSSDRFTRASNPKEHILVCLSSSPSNEKLIRTAAQMAADQTEFTALYVETPADAAMTEPNRARLKAHMELAVQLGAHLETVSGTDIPYQIAEYARISGITSVLIGQSSGPRIWGISHRDFAKAIQRYAPDLDIHIIPNQLHAVHHTAVFRLWLSQDDIMRDFFYALAFLFFATCLALLFKHLGLSDANVIPVYILSVLLISYTTSNAIPGFLSSLAAMLLFNFLFTEPKYTLLAYDAGYPTTFLIMFVISLITGNLTQRVKQSAIRSQEDAYRTKILFDTQQLIYKEHGQDSILATMAEQLVALLGRSIILSKAEDGTLMPPTIFSGPDSCREDVILSDYERETAQWVFANRQHGGASTHYHPDARCLYYAVYMQSHVYAVIGIWMDESILDPLESSILLSLLGECGMALENDRNIREKEDARLQAQNEKLRANLLRTISHDLRTPLTTISGNVYNLLTQDITFDEETRHQIYSDIYDDSVWLNQLVENLLSISRIEEGNMRLNTQTELLEEVISAAMNHLTRQKSEHEITVYECDEMLLVKIDGRLIVQVLINLLNNAILHTQKGSRIEIRTEKKDGYAVVSILDNGPGILPEDLNHIFEMFYTGKHKIADSHRSLGLGLALCRSIILAHNGTIQAENREPSGACFRFTLPLEEVPIHE